MVPSWKRLLNHGIENMQERLQEHRQQLAAQAQQLQQREGMKALTRQQLQKRTANAHTVVATLRALGIAIDGFPPYSKTNVDKAHRQVLLLHAAAATFNM